MRFFFLKLLLLTLITSCNSDDVLERPTGAYIPPSKPAGLVEGVDYFLPNIDLSEWKVTLPIADTDGSPIEIHPPAISNYATNSILQPFMYNDSTDGSIVFYTYPGGATTTNSSYPRTELRELMNGGDGKTNWTFAQGGQMKGTLALEDISTGDRTIIMQIHGRLTDAQKSLIGASDNNAPPMLKIYWTNGYVRVKTKVLNDLNATYEESLETSAWGDDDGYTFPEAVGNAPFTLEIIASDGKMEVILNDTTSKVYDDIHVQKWGIFENYFKAGNYLVSTNTNAFAKVKYYELEVTH